MVVCLGQLLLDFISLATDEPLGTATRLEPLLGGSAANVAVGLHHHGVPVRLLSKIGDDATGHRARALLEAHGLPSDGVAIDPEHPTRFIRIGVTAAGTPTLEIGNPRSADLYLRPEEVPLGILNGARALVLSGTMLLGETSARTTLALLERARRQGCLIAFDPNIRPSRTPRPERIRERLAAVLPFVDLLQTHRRDWADLWGSQSATGLLREGISLLVQTAGADGATLQTPHHSITVPAEPVQAVDPTGTGDAFLAALLSYLVAQPEAVRSRASPEALQRWGHAAAGWAARIAQHRGATTAYAV